jgi:hypothetical protein
MELSGLVSWHFFVGVCTFTAMVLIVGISLAIMQRRRLRNYENYKRENTSKYSSVVMKL